jgi:ATP-dependent Lhr-like helicase
VLAATDPAQPYGAALPWPRKDEPAESAAKPPRAGSPRRVAGAYVVLAGAEPLVFVERGGKGLSVLVDHEDPRLGPALEALADFVRAGRLKKLDLEKVDGGPILGTALEPLLVDLGFRLGPRKLTLTA